MADQLIPFLTAAVLLTVSPGPDIIYVLVQGMANGKKYGTITAFGLLTGILFHTSLVAFGVSVIIKESVTLFLIIKILGALYLFYLAYMAWKSDPRIAYSVEGIPQRSLFSLFRQGFLMNILNPKVTIFFFAFFPGFLWDPEGNTLYQFYVLGFLFMLQALLIFTLVALLAGKISKYLQRHRYSGVVLKWLQVIIFIGIGFLILT